MSGHDAIDDALDAAIDALLRGRPLDAALYDQRPHGSALLPLLETAEAVRTAPPPPLPRELPHNYTIVRAAVERARAASPEAEQPERTAAPRWWSRRLTFASLTIPAGAAALILTAGAAGATASVFTTDLGATVADAVLPAQLADQLPGNSGDAPGHNRTPGGGAPSGGPGPSADEAPGSDNQPTAMEVSGTISDVSGGNFTLTNAEGVWHVQTDVGTEISGEILEGAIADVEGVVTAEKNVHATGVSASGGTPSAPPGPERTPPAYPDAGPPDGGGSGPPDDAGAAPEVPQGPGASNDQERGDDGGNPEP